MTKDFIFAAKANEITEGAFQAVELEGKRLLVCHTKDGFFVIDDTCSHDKGTLAEGFLEDNEIECPRHGARFDVTSGEVTCLPAPTAINSYPVKVEGEEVKVRIG